MFCTYCGAPNPDDAAFCSTCGREQKRADLQQQPADRSGPAPDAASVAPRSAASPLPPPSPAASPPSPSPPPIGTVDVRAARRRAAYVALAALVIGVLGGGLFYRWSVYQDERRREAEAHDAQERAALAELDKRYTPAVPGQPAGDPASLQNDADSTLCDRLASHPSDPQRVGDGVALRAIDVSQALPACERAAARTPARPRYQYEYGRALEAASRLNEAVQQYTLAERAGYAMADFNLGLAYLDGRGVARSRESAVAFLSRADAAGVKDVRSAIGDAYLYGEPPDYAQAKRWYESAIEREEPQGYAGLAVLYDLGYGVDTDRVRGAAFARKAADLGNVNGMFWIGRHYRDGQGVDPDPMIACGWFDRAARADYAYAQLEAGRCFYTGSGGERNHASALYWLDRAARAGLPEAQELVADMYDTGDGVVADPAMAVAWYRKAAEQNDVYGMMQLGVHLREGRGVAWSEAEAMQWFEKAARTGYAAAQSSLAQGYLLGLGLSAGQGRQDYEQAAYWFGEAAKQGEGFAQLNLGVMYENGWGVAQDFARAKDLYAQAAGSSNSGAAKTGAEYLASLSSAMESVQVQQRAEANRPSNTDAWIGIIATVVAAGAVAELLSWSSRGSDTRGQSGVSSPGPSRSDYTPDWNWSGGGGSGGGGSLTVPVDPPTRPDLYYPSNPTRSVNGDLSDPSIARR